MRKLMRAAIGAALVISGFGVGAFAVSELRVLTDLYTRSAPRDLAGNVVIPDMPISYDPTTVHHVRDGRLVIPSVGLDVRLGEIRSMNGVINPPSFDGAYLVRDLGTADGTIFVVMHSLRGGGIGPGNFVIDIPGGRVAVEIGAIVEVDGWAYRVVETHVVSKAELAAQPDIWRDIPGRLVVMTCLQNPRNTPSTDNAVIIAARVTTAQQA